jgi:two-component system, chemotaxis family, CheB/CheR fusion protein
MLNESDRLLLSRYAPACVLVDEDLNILQFRGETSLYLEHLPGLASLNLQKLARPTLLVALSTAISQARKEEAPARREGVTIRAQGEARGILLEVIPIRVPESNVPGFLILFEESPRQKSGRKRRIWLESLFDKLLSGKRLSTARSERDREFLKVKQELDAARGLLASDN